ncbi:hypothetical protein D3C75_1162180 [compost metagenome]
MVKGCKLVGGRYLGFLRQETLQNVIFDAFGNLQEDGLAVINHAFTSSLLSWFITHITNYISNDPFCQEGSAKKPPAPIGTGGLEKAVRVKVDYCRDGRPK